MGEQRDSLANFEFKLFIYTFVDSNYASIYFSFKIRVQAAKDKKPFPFADRGPDANIMLLLFKCQCSKFQCNVDSAEYTSAGCGQHVDGESDCRR